MRMGMTLVEVLAVLVILGLLAATLTVGLGGKMGQAKQDIARTQIGQIVAQVETFRLARNRLPTAAEGLDVLTQDPQAAYYLDVGKIQDPWGNTFHYLVPGPTGHDYEVITYGADGQVGGTSDQQDVSSANLSRSAEPGF